MLSKIISSFVLLTVCSLKALHYKISVMNVHSLLKQSMSCLLFTTSHFCIVITMKDHFIFPFLSFINLKKNPSLNIFLKIIPGTCLAYKIGRSVVIVFLAKKRITSTLLCSG